MGRKPEGCEREGVVCLAEVFGEERETQMLEVVLVWADSTAWLVGSVLVGREIVCSCLRLRATALLHLGTA